MAALTITKHQVIRKNRAHTVVIYSETSADVYWKAVNPATGKGWQRSRDLQAFRGEKAQGRAMVAWMKAARS